MLRGCTVLLGVSWLRCSIDDYHFELVACFAEPLAVTPCPRECVL